MIVTIEDAIKHKSFYHEHSREIVKGDVNKAFEEAAHVLNGSFQMSGQEHFYLETHAVLVVPKGEDEEIDIVCSTQNPSEVQEVVSKVLNIPANRGEIDKRHQAIKLTCIKMDINKQTIINPIIFKKLFAE